MKKMLSLLLSALMILVLCASACGEGTPEPEGGKKFHSDWAMFNMTVEVNYEEEGYRVYIKSSDPYEHNGYEWEYSCYYVEDKDALVSVYSSKSSYTEDPATLETTRGEYEYQEMDDENTVTTFTVNENGKLIWNCGRGEEGMDLEFTNIGAFKGYWKNADGRVTADITWSDSEIGDEYGYHIALHEDLGYMWSDYSLHGLYDPDTGKLTATGTVEVTGENEYGEFVTEEQPADPDHPLEIVFSDLGGGKILLEKDGGTELFYDMMGAPEENG